jgi:hypothetical protein
MDAIKEIVLSDQKTPKMMSKLENNLLHIKFFADHKPRIASSAYKALLENLEFEYHPKGACITRSGKKGHKFYVLCKGELAVLIPRGDQRINIIPKTYIDKFNQAGLFDLNESDESDLAASEEEVSDNKKKRAQAKELKNFMARINETLGGGGLFSGLLGLVGAGLGKGEGVEMVKESRTKISLFAALLGVGNLEGKEGKRGKRFEPVSTPLSGLFASLKRKEAGGVGQKNAMLELIPEEMQEEKPVKGKTALSGLLADLKKKAPSPEPNAMLELIPEAPPVLVKGKTALSGLLADLKKKAPSPEPNAMLGLIDGVLPAYEETPRTAQIRINSKAKTPSSSQSSDSQKKPTFPQSEPMINLDIEPDPDERSIFRASGLDVPWHHTSGLDPINSLAPPIESDFQRRSINNQVQKSQQEATKQQPDKPLWSHHMQ